MTPPSVGPNLIGSTRSRSRPGTRSVNRGCSLSYSGHQDRELPRPNLQIRQQLGPGPTFPIPERSSAAPSPPGSRGCRRRKRVAPIHPGGQVDQRLTGWYGYDMRSSSSGRSRRSEKCLMIAKGTNTPVTMAIAPRPQELPHPSGLHRHTPSEGPRLRSRRRTGRTRPKPTGKAVVGRSLSWAVRPHARS